jgi:hypothetical protein
MRPSKPMKNLDKVGAALEIEIAHFRMGIS